MCLAACVGVGVDGNGNGDHMSRSGIGRSNGVNGARVLVAGPSKRAIGGMLNAAIASTSRWTLLRSRTLSHALRAPLLHFFLSLVPSSHTLQKPLRERISTLPPRQIHSSPPWPFSFSHLRLRSRSRGVNPCSRNSFRHPSMLKNWPLSTGPKLMPHACGMGNGKGSGGRSGWVW